MASLNHIGIAVQNLPQLKKLFELLDLHLSHSEKVAEQGVMTHFFPFPQAQGQVQTQLELLESIDPNGPVGQFLKKRGPGIHHLSFTVKKGELEPLSEKLKQSGFRLIYDKPKVGAHHMRINFIHPSTAEGILIELMEPG